MRLEVDIAGHVEPWRLRGSRAVEAWLAGKPWLEIGGCRVVALGRAVDVEAVLGGLRRLVRGIDDGHVGARVEVLEVGAPGSLQADLCRFFDVPTDGDPRDRLRSLGRAMTYERCCFILTTPSDETLLFDEATALCEAIYKVTAVAAAFLVVHTKVSMGDGVRFDLSSGWPMEGVLPRATNDAARWRAYLHLLVGWETGGRPMVATEWGGGCDGIDFGDEDELLRHLDDCAAVAYNGVPATLRGAVDDGLDRRSAAWSHARNAGLLWCAPGETRESLCPWVRRALRGYAERGIHGGLLACDWLNRELLSACFAIERLLRRNYDAALARVEPPFDVIVRLGNPASKRMLRPDASEAVVDPWSVASFGEMIKAVRHVMPADERRHLDNVRAIRNAAAHGQPLGWAAVHGLARAFAEIAWFPTW